MVCYVIVNLYITMGECCFIIANLQLFYCIYNPITIINYMDFQKVKDKNGLLLYI